VTGPRLLDVYCGPGGAARGYQHAGWHVTGVDITPQPYYCGEEFHQGDALEFLAAHWLEFDAIHGSPICQGWARVTDWRGSRSDHPDLLTPTLDFLRAQVTTVPWVIENVPEAAELGPLRPDLLLCGTALGLPIRRHRAFETSWRALQLTSQCAHRSTDLAFDHSGERAYADAMGCGWMPAKAARQAIPPAYTQYIGELMLAELAERAA
jgi:SAM-dependent methyltransferase